MAAQPELTFTAVAAIDFGTARSGYGFAFSGVSYPEVICPTDWVGGQGLNVKALTNILLDKTTKKYKYFGYEAREVYLEQCEDGNADLFFETFKMSLYKKDGVQNKIASSCGTEIDSHIVFREALAFMKDQVLQKINAASVSEDAKVLARDIMWVVTVPGMWQNKAKAVMRKAAEDAGMGPHNLMLALEPEAASFHVRSELKEADIPVGGKYIVVDCGGGTVDFACHEVCAVGVKETHPATGGPWGSTFIDKAFISLLCDVFTQEKITNFQNQNPAAWLKFLSDWENTKIGVTVKHFKRGKRVPPPNSLFRYLGKMDGITQMCKSYSNSEQAKAFNRIITFSEDGGFKLNGGALQSLFMPLLDEISKKIEELLESNDVKDSTHLFVVGGFAQSNVLQTHLNSKFPKLRSVTPLRPALSVINGSVKYGMDPSFVTARKSPHTYGIGYRALFIEGLHPPSKKCIIDNTTYCSNTFGIFVRKGQSINFGESVSHGFCFFKEHDNVTLRFYTSDDTNPIFTTDYGCEHIGSLVVTKPPHINVDHCSGGSSCNMEFGGTEIRVTVTVKKTGTKLTTVLDFK